MILKKILVGLFSLVFCVIIANMWIFENPDPVQFVYKLKRTSGGSCTAFAVQNGYIVTAAHCVEKNEINEYTPVLLISSTGDIFTGDVIHSDDSIDIAILRSAVAKVGYGLKISNETFIENEQVYFFGFLADISSAPIKQEARIVLCKLFNGNIRIFTTGSDVWPGTSGGPLLNNSGEVIGVASATTTHVLGDDLFRYLGIFSSISFLSEVNSLN